MDEKSEGAGAVNFGLDPEQQLVVDTVRSFVEDEFHPLEDDGLGPARIVKYSRPWTETPSVRVPDAVSHHQEKHP